MRKFNKLFLVSLVLLLLAACSTQQPQSENNPFTDGQVSLTLKKNVTTKEEVTRVFGAPNIVTQDNGKTTWVYQKNAQMSGSQSKGIFGTILLLSAGQSSSSSSQSSRTMTLMITFNKHDRVESFKSMTTTF